MHVFINNEQYQQMNKSVIVTCINIKYYNILTLYLNGCISAEESFTGLTCQGTKMMSQCLVSAHLAYFFSKHTSTLPHWPLFFYLIRVRIDRFLTIS